MSKVEKNEVLFADIKALDPVRRKLVLMYIESLVSSLSKK